MAKSTVIQEAAKLVAMKKRIDILMDEVAAIKLKLLPYVRLAPMQVAGGKVVYVKGSESHYLNKNKMRQVLEEILKLSPQMVDRVMAMGAQKRIVSDYVKVTTEG